MNTDTNGPRLSLPAHKTTTQLLFMSFLGLDNVKAGTFSSRFNDTLLDRRKKDADRSNGPIIVRNPTPILYEETL